MGISDTQTTVWLFDRPMNSSQARGRGLAPTPWIFCLAHEIQPTFAKGEFHQAIHEMSISAPTNNTFDLASVAATKRLPSLPNVAQRMLEIAQQDEPDYGELCKIIRTDPVISGRILRTVNSALFAIRPKIESIEVAIPRLGVSAIRTLILSFHLASWKASSSETKGVFRSVWRSCLTQGVIAELLAEKTKLDPSTCFTGGLVQDIGIIAMATEIGDEYVTEVLQSDSQSESISIEKERFGFTHVDVGVEILKRWNMGDNFVDAIKSHHESDSALKPNADNMFAAVLQAANLGAEILTECAALSDVDRAVDRWMRVLNSQFGFNPDDAQNVISEIEERVSEYSSLFAFDIADNDSVERVVERAKDLLQDIALESQMQLIAAQRKTKEPEIDEAAFRDYLSGLYNRRFLSEMMDSRLETWVKKRKPIAMLYLDVDKFKSINDTYGHVTGDNAIKHVADWLRKCTRENDFVFRLGGDEFLVVMQIKESHYKTAANRLAKDIPSLVCSNSGEVEMSLSVGGVHFKPKRGGPGFDLNSMIDKADKQMYAAKNSGGNSVSLA
jgi:diguanylate cyclase (GGDEF)-like protein